MPSAYSGGTSTGPANSGNLEVNQDLLDFLEANTQGKKYLMAVPSSMQRSDYIIAAGRPMLLLGGFKGDDKVTTSEELTQMVADGELRYVYWDANGRGGFGNGSSGVNGDVST